MTRTVAVLSLLLLLGCSFERRPNGDEDVEGSLARDQPALPGASLDPAASALQTIRVFRESVEIGDLSLALALLDREVEIVDHLVANAPRSVGTLSRGEALLELRRLHSEGLVLEELGSELVLRQDAALIHARIAVLHRNEETGVAREVTRGHETILMVPSTEGWRIRLLHRSLDPPSSP